MKKLFLSLIFIISVNNLVYADESLPVDDSTPYMPYPERIEIIKEVPAQPAPKTQKNKNNKPAKKTTRKKTTTAKKKSTTPAKKITSLERGIALMKEERYEAAKPYLQKAIQEERNNPNAWYWYGVYHEKTGKFSQAQYFYSKAVTIDPALEPLSRVVYYPNDNEKTPLWDPKRPARVYPVATKNDGLVIGKGNFPTAPNDPEIPHVPVYVPPEPGSNPMDGDNWAPAIYVPPAPQEIESAQQNVNNTLPVYVPPQPNNIQENYAYKIPGYSNTYVEPEKFDVRADLPLYNPPEPGKITAEAHKEEIKEARPAAAKNAKKVSENKTAPRKIVKKSAPAKKQTTKKNKKQEVKKSETQPKKQTNEQTKIKPETKQTKTQQKAEPVKPQPKKQATQQTQQRTTKKEQPKKTETAPKKINKSEKTEVPVPSVQSENKTKVTPKKVEKVEKPEKTEKTEKIEIVETPKPVAPVKPAEPKREQNKTREITQDAVDLPPVGQSAPDPGTIVESEFPPVGQGN